MPKPRQGKEVKKHCSIRLEPRVRSNIESKYKKVQNWIDAMVKKEKLDQTEEAPAKD